MTIRRVVEDRVLGFGERDILVFVQGDFEKLEDVFAALVLEPVKLVEDAEFAV